MRIRHRHLPDGDVRRHRRQELAQRQRHNVPHIVRPRQVRAATHAPQIEERPRVHRDAGQLDHCHRHRIRELVQQHLADHIVAGRHNVPEQAQHTDADRFAAHSTDGDRGPAVRCHAASAAAAEGRAGGRSGLSCRVFVCTGESQAGVVGKWIVQRALDFSSTSTVSGSVVAVSLWRTRASLTHTPSHTPKRTPKHTETRSRV